MPRFWYFPDFHKAVTAAVDRGSIEQMVTATGTVAWAPGDVAPKTIAVQIGSGNLALGHRRWILGGAVLLMCGVGAVQALVDAPVRAAFVTAGGALIEPA